MSRDDERVTPLVVSAAMGHIAAFGRAVARSTLEIERATQNVWPVNSSASRSDTAIVAP